MSNTFSYCASYLQELSNEILNYSDLQSKNQSKHDVREMIEALDWIVPLIKDHLTNPNLINPDLTNPDLEGAPQTLATTFSENVVQSVDLTMLDSLNVTFPISLGDVKAGYIGILYGFYESGEKIEVVSTSDDYKNMKILYRGKIIDVTYKTPGIYVEVNQYENPRSVLTFRKPCDTPFWQLPSVENTQVTFNCGGFYSENGLNRRFEIKQISSSLFRIKFLDDDAEIKLDLFDGLCKVEERFSEKYKGSFNFYENPDSCVNCNKYVRYDEFWNKYVPLDKNFQDISGYLPDQSKIKRKTPMPPPLFVGDVGTLRCCSDKYGFDVINITKNGSEITISFGGGTILEWRRPGRWIKKGNKSKDSKYTSYHFGVKITELDPCF